MVRIITNTLRSKNNTQINGSANSSIYSSLKTDFISRKAKLLAWAMFLYYFIENGTLGLIPSSFYTLYKTVKISDLILYGLVIYSLMNIKEYESLYKSKTLIIVKLLLVYLLFEFIISVVQYSQNPLEYFFRLKGVWSSFLIFPFLLLFKRNGLNYLIKLVLPVAIVSNIFYILTALTGVAFLPGVDIVKQTLPGGLKVLRVYGGTFYGEVFFVGFIYKWITDKFRLYQLPLVILFVTPHILAFGRGAWIKFTLIILIMVVWNMLKKKNLKSILKQIAVVCILGVLVIYSFVQFIPGSDYYVEALGSRVTQGEEDYKYKEGTYGTRLASTGRLFDLWINSNVLLGVGFHPLWVIKPVTTEENLYAWGFSDVRWAAVLATYGALGFLMAVIFQIYYFIMAFKVLKYNKNNDIQQLFVIIMFAMLLFDTVFDFSNSLISFALWGFYAIAANIAALVYKYEEINKYTNLSVRPSSQT
jgi:hypothetical protein